MLRVGPLRPLDQLMTNSPGWWRTHTARLPREGNLDMMIYLVESGAGFPDSGSLAVTRDCKIVEWLRELQLDPAHAFVKAAREDDVCAFEQTESFDDHALNQMYLKEACIHGAFNVLEFFRLFVDVGPTPSDVATALHFQMVDILDWYWEFFPRSAGELRLEP